MATKYYCSKCGVQLEHSRKAVPGKGIILDLISPHECEGYSIKSNPDENPTAEDIINSAKPLGAAKLVSKSTNKPDGGQSSFDLGDRRSEVRSAAPQGILDQMKNLEPTGTSEGE